MDQPENEPSAKSIDLGSVQNLDTARMALRWALERIRSLEREQAAQTAGQGKDQEDRHALKLEIARLQFESNGLQLQLERLKKMMAMRPADMRASVDADNQALNEREREVLRLEKALEQKRLRSEQELKERMAGLQTDLERDCRQRLDALPEREAGLKQQEHDLAARRKHFEEYSASARAQMDLEAKDLKIQAEEMARLRADIQRRHDSLAEDWTREKRSLLAELTELRSKMRGPFAPNPELESRLAAALEELQKTRLARGAAEQKVRFAEIERESALSLIKLFEQELPDQILKIAELAKAFPQKIAELKTEHLWSQERQELVRMLREQEESLRNLQEQLRAARKAAPKAAEEPAKSSTPAETSREPERAAAKPRPARTAQMEAELLAAQRQLAADAYASAVTAIRFLFADAGTAPAASEPASLVVAVERIVNLLHSNNQALVARVSRAPGDNGPHVRAVNLAILCMHVGLGLRWEPSRLLALGLAAALGDPELGEGLTARVLAGDEAVRRAVSQILASRKSGAGGPRKPQDAQPEAQIIELCGRYEAMIHPRGGSAAVLPAAAIKAMFRDQAQEFSRPIMQAFVQRITPFPPGSYLKLTEGEVACVVETHPDFPTRPKIEVEFQSDLTPQSPPLIVDLAQNPTIQIRGPFDPATLPG